MIQTHPLPRSVGSWVLAVGEASSKHSWRTVLPLVLSINKALHLWKETRVAAVAQWMMVMMRTRDCVREHTPRRSQPLEHSVASSWHCCLLLSLVGDHQEMMLNNQAGTLFPHHQLSYIASSLLGPRSCFSSTSGSSRENKLLPKSRAPSERKWSSF